MTSTSGECLCGQIKVSLPKEALTAPGKTLVCHCKNCRQTGGTYASIVAMVPQSAVTISGQPKIYYDTNTTSGKPVQRAFCGNCGSPIYTTPNNLPGVLIVKLGLFDEIPSPSMEVFCKAKPSWDKPIDGAKQFDTVPTR